MIIGDRLRDLREQKKLSQGEIEQRTGLLRCYISRVENGHTVPSVETLEKFARALEVPMYQLFYDGDLNPKLPIFSRRKPGNGHSWGKAGRTPACWQNSANCLAVRTRMTGNFSCTWRKRWQSRTRRDWMLGVIK